MADLAQIDAIEEFQRERDRCVDRLRTMPLPRLPAAAGSAYECSRAIVALTPGARDHALPRLADRAAGDQLAVVTADLLASEPDARTLADATAELTRLRRSLP